MEGVRELQIEGYIHRDETRRSNDFIVLTENGKDAVELQLDPDSRARKYYL